MYNRDTELFEESDRSFNIGDACDFVGLAADDE